MPHAYLIRYGLMGRLGRFSAESDGYDRGQTVVVRTGRGIELGEVLLRAPASTASWPSEDMSADRSVPSAVGPCLLRAAGREDLEQARQAESRRHERFLACERVLGEGEWPLQLIDVEPLFDDSHTVLYYLGAHHLDVDGLLPALRRLCGFDVRLEPAGIDAAEDDAETLREAEAEFGCGSCGSGGGCGSANGGGCGSNDDAHADGCSTCAVRELVRSRH